MSSYHIDQSGRVVELHKYPDGVWENAGRKCEGCLYTSYTVCADTGSRRPLDKNNYHVSCFEGIFVEVTYDE